MKWRFIEQETYSADINMAIDHAIYEGVGSGREKPTIRFYKWIPSSVSLGAYQNTTEINLNACKKYNVGVVRRMTGGGSVFHDNADFTYSIAAPLRIFDNSIENAYKQICSWVINALNEFGIKANLENKNDIFVDGKKISGNAAKALDKGVYFQHGTLVYDIDFEVMSSVLNISKDLVNEKVTSVLQNKNISPNKVYDKLKNSFTLDKEFKTKELSKFELMRAKDLANTRYRTIMLPAGSLVKNKGACYVVSNLHSAFS